MTKDPGPLYREPAKAEARAETNRQANRVVEALVKASTEAFLRKLLAELRLLAPEALFNGSYAAAQPHPNPRLTAYSPMSVDDVAPFVAEAVKEYVMLLDEGIDE